ncbi:hypothetical protein GQ44DRAFT_665987 [Phaeosphaeriaceae sp. PMI808]|nr:hypothetical protein GQ44DRAFT_665987 [Phaeosphaeriaceae sp. PMI808]
MEQRPRFNVLELNCKRQDDVTHHAYCRSCLADLFRSSLMDTTLFPPRCCGIRIRSSSCVDLLPPELMKQCEEKEMEFTTPNPVYCSNRFCAQFIRPENVIAEIATCPTCDAKTCTVCKNPNHKGLCPQDPAVQVLMDIAGKKKWQRCYKCRTMVELHVGCYHMRCRCGGEFCYLCAKPWKTCSCSQWDENRLLLNGRAVDAPAHPITMPEEEEMPEPDPAVEVLDDLHLRLATVASGFAINNDDDGVGGEGDGDVRCTHLWQRVYGKPEMLEVCGVCHYHLKFVNNCKMCGTKVCNRCLNNRL